jgi:hypothetical protein
MKRIHILSLVILAVVATAIGGMAIAQGETSTISGAIVSMSGSSLVIRADDNSKMTFTLDENSLLPNKISPGDRVTVSYHILDGGIYHAADVTATPTSTTSAATTPAGTAQQGQQPATSADTGMPRTASPLPFVALMGVLSVGGAFFLRAVARRAA